MQVMVRVLISARKCTKSVWRLRGFARARSTHRGAYNAAPDSLSGFRDMWSRETIDYIFYECFYWSTFYNLFNIHPHDHLPVCGFSRSPQVISYVLISYLLLLVVFLVRRTVQPQYVHYRQTTDDRRTRNGATLQHMSDRQDYRLKTTRNQAVARIADCTASQHLRGSRDVIDHVTI